MTDNPHPGTARKLLHLAFMSDIPKAFLTKPTMAHAKKAKKEKDR